MAAVLESVAVPRSSGFKLSASATSVVGSSVCAVSSSRKIGSFAEFSGLKIQSPKRAFGSVSSRTTVNRRGGIVCEAQKATLEVPGVNDTTWDSLVIESSVPVLVEFWAPWCGPCRMMHPVIGELSKEYAGKLNCYNLNTDESPSVATKYGIRSIPTVMIFKSGEKKDTIIGAVPKSTITASVEKFL